MNGTLPAGALAGDAQYVVLSRISKATSCEPSCGRAAMPGRWQQAADPVKDSLKGRTVRVRFGTYNDGNGEWSAAYVH